MTTWFSADLHFSHNNIIRYCNRPFSSVEEMNEKLIENWNSVVKPTDTAYILGDFSFSHNVKEIAKHWAALNGNKKLIYGNHDGSIIKYQWDFDPSELSGHYKEITIEKQKIILCHYAMRVWNGSGYGSWMLYGHSHGTLEEDLNALSFDVGVDCHNYFPISFEQVRARMLEKKKLNNEQVQE